MALNFNGVTLATNIDAVVVNGTAVSKVMFNGTEVWAKAANLVLSIAGAGSNIQISGNLFRFIASGTWITVNNNGTFVGSCTSVDYFRDIIGSGNTLVANNGASGAVTFNISTKNFTSISFKSLSGDGNCLSGIMSNAGDVFSLGGATDEYGCVSSFNTKSLRIR